jgi:hypothetical protein
VVEGFTLAPSFDGTRLTYTGELSTDLGRVGELWGSLVTRTRRAAMRSWLAAAHDTGVIKAESQRRSR